jgi:hypothetical protein
MKYRIEARNIIFTAFREGRVSFEKAVEMAAKIDHPTDRADTLLILEDYANAVHYGDKPLGIAGYFIEWVKLMVASTYGIKAHLELESTPANFIFTVLAALAALVVLASWKQGRRKEPLLLAGIALLYIAYLFYFINFQTYLFFRNEGMSVAGRYLFPVLPSLYMIAIAGTFNLLRNKAARTTVALAIAVLFIGADLPLFILKASPDWYFLFTF